MLFFSENLKICISLICLLHCKSVDLKKSESDVKGRLSWTNSTEEECRRDKDSCQCEIIDVTLTQTIENEGFHRILKLLVEFDPENILSKQCELNLLQVLPAGAFVNPDELEDLSRNNQKAFKFVLLGKVDVEQPMHHSEEHSVHLYRNVTTKRIHIDLPIHFRYQRATIGGDFGKVTIPYPSVLLKCGRGKPVCGTLRMAPKFDENVDLFYTNISFKSITNEIEVLVPIGNLDHYPLISIVTFLVTCAGCCYILSVFLTKPLPT